MIGSSILCWSLFCSKLGLDLLENIQLHTICGKGGLGIKNGRNTYSEDYIFVMSHFRFVMQINQSLTTVHGKIATVFKLILFYIFVFDFNYVIDNLSQQATVEM